MFVDGGESVKRTDLETGVDVDVDVLLGWLSLLVVVARREGLSCCAAMKSDDRDGSLGCDMLLRRRISVPLLAEKP